MTAAVTYNSALNKTLRVDRVHLGERTFEVSTALAPSGAYETVVFEVDSTTLVSIGNSEILAMSYYGRDAHHYDILAGVINGEIPAITYDQKKEEKPVNEYRQIIPFTHNELGAIEEIIHGWIDTYDDFIRDKYSGMLPSDEKLMDKYHRAIRLRHKTYQLFLNTCDGVATCLTCRCLWKTFDRFPNDTQCPHCNDATEMQFCQDLRENGWCVICEHIEVNGLREPESEEVRANSEALDELRRKLAGS